MKLRELIGKYDTNVKIGCKDGNAFVYCGNLNDLDIRKTDMELMSALASALSHSDKELKTIKRKRNNPKIEYPKYVESAKAKEKEYLPIDKWTDDLRKNKIRVETAKKRTLTRMLNYKSIGSREIVETYKSQTETNTGIIIIEGDDVGRAWTTDEYVRGVQECANGVRTIDPTKDIGA